MRTEVALRWLLRFVSVTTVPALLAAVMPQPWLAHLIGRAEPGAATGILVTYLARALMAMYALAGALCLVMSFDPRRYLPLIAILGVGSLLAALGGLAALVVGVSPGDRSPVFWIVFGDLAEGLVQSALVLFLVQRMRSSTAERA